MSTKAGATQKAPKEPKRLANESETAEYIADLLGQLEKMAGTAGFVRLQYLLKESADEAKGLSAGA